MDVGCGTGAFGILLKEKGFTNITGLDPSQVLLDKLDQTEAYKASRCMYIGMGLDKYPEDLKGKFDIVTATGVFLDGHIPALGFEDIHASLKPNGYFVTGLRAPYWEDGHETGYKDKFNELVAAGKWKLV